MICVEKYRYVSIIKRKVRITQHLVDYIILQCCVIWTLYLVIDHQKGMTLP
jgi:hypothetical protein